MASRRSFALGAKFATVIVLVSEKVSTSGDSCSRLLDRRDALPGLVVPLTVESGFNEHQVKRLQALARRLKTKRAPFEADRMFPKAEWLAPVMLSTVAGPTEACYDIHRTKVYERIYRVAGPINAEFINWDGVRVGVRAELDH